MNAEKHANTVDAYLSIDVTTLRNRLLRIASIDIYSHTLIRTNEQDRESTTVIGYRFIIDFPSGFQL